MSSIQILALWCMVKIFINFVIRFVIVTVAIEIIDYWMKHRGSKHRKEVHERYRSTRQFRNQL